MKNTKQYHLWIKSISNNLNDTAFVKCLEIDREQFNVISLQYSDHEYPCGKLDGWIKDICIKMNKPWLIKSYKDVEWKNISYISNSFTIHLSYEQNSEMRNQYSNMLWWQHKWELVYIKVLNFFMSLTVI